MDELESEWRRRSGIYSGGFIFRNEREEKAIEWRT
jgi:hypothetical protein